MPRQLEIRTTILAKKSGGRAREKDANANDLYEDEALQLLQELQQLKSNVRSNVCIFQVTWLVLFGVVSTYDSQPSQQVASM